MAAPILALAAKTAAKWAISAVAADVMVNKLRPYWKPVAAMAVGIILVKAPGKIKQSFRSGIKQITWLPRRLNPFTRNESPSLKFLKVAGVATAVLLGVTALTSGAGLAVPLAVAAAASFITGNILSQRASMVENTQVPVGPANKKSGHAERVSPDRSMKLSYDQKLSLALKRTASPITQTQKQVQKVSQGVKL